MPTLKIHPALRVVFRGDRVIVWTPRQAQPSSLTAQDLDRLHGLFSDQAQPPLSEGETRELLAAGFLVAPADGSAMVEPVDAVELPAADAPPVDLPPGVRRVNHFCLQPGPAGWVAWSPARCAPMGKAKMRPSVMRNKSASASTASAKKLSLSLGGGRVAPGVVTRGYPADVPRESAVFPRTGDR